MSVCGCYPHGPDEPCTCDGFRGVETPCGCERTAESNCWQCRCICFPGKLAGCTCDINWDCTGYDPCAQRARVEASCE